MSSAASLYSKQLGKGRIGKIPRSPLKVSEVRALRRSIDNIEAIAAATGDQVDAWEIGFEKAIAIDHFETLAWLKWYMSDPKNQTSVGVRALIVAILFETGIEKPTYEFTTLTRFGERQFDNIFENGDGEDVVDELIRFAVVMQSERVFAGIRRYGWDRASAPRAA